MSVMPSATSTARRYRLATADEVAAMLRSPAFCWPEGVRVEELRVVEDADHAGEEALYIRVILADDAPPHQLTPDLLRAMRGPIFDLLRDDPRFPYISILRQADLAEVEAAAGDEEE